MVNDSKGHDGCKRLLSFHIIPSLSNCEVGELYMIATRWNAVRSEFVLLVVDGQKLMCRFSNILQTMVTSQIGTLRILEV